MEIDAYLSCNAKQAIDTGARQGFTPIMIMNVDREGRTMHIVALTSDMPEIRRLLTESQGCERLSI
jgi:hypothetical protein